MSRFFKNMKKIPIFLSCFIILGLFIIPKITIASDSTVEAKILSISPSGGAIGDDVEILIPDASDIFSDCLYRGIYASHDLSARVYFNNIETILKSPIYYSFPDGDIIHVTVPLGASTGKIKVELMCKHQSWSNNDYDYNATILSMSNFTILSPVAQDDLSVRQQYLQQTKVDQAWNYTHGSSDVVVAVIDDGVYTGHPDLAGNMWINSKEIEGNGKDDDNNGYIDDKWGWNFISNSKNITTLGNHGTMVAGIIGAEGSNNIGITGINWNIRLMPLIACDDNGCGDVAIKKAIKYAVDNGADIINLSLGGSVFNYTDDYNEIIKYAFDENVLVVISAGNGDLDGGIGRNLNITKVSPVCNDGNGNMVLGVGAVDSNNKITSWSNYGNCVDIYAPGEKIISTAVPAHSSAGSSLDGLYDYADGTSFSAPIVTGIAALIKAQYPNIKNSAIRDRIVNNSDVQNGVRVTNAYKAISQPFIDSEKYINNVSNIANKVVAQEEKIIPGVDNQLSKKMSGKILLQVESHGEAYYVNPKTLEKYYMADGNKAYDVMRNLGVGITNKNLEKIKANKTFAKKNAGKIFLQVEANGEAFYINFDGTAHYLKDGAAAYEIMRSLGLGITNDNLNKIPEGSL